VVAKLTGYADRVSVRPGDRIAFSVSAVGPDPVRARVVRIVSGDPNPAAPPRKFVACPEIPEATFPATPRSAHPGSYAEIPTGAGFALPARVRLDAIIWPTLPQSGPQAVLSRRDPATGAGFSLLLSETGMVLETGSLRVQTGKKLRRRAWYAVWAEIDTAKGTCTVGQRALKPVYGTDDSGEATLAGAVRPDGGSAILIGADASATAPGQRYFNGKIEAPAIEGVARWDLSKGIGTLDVTDTGPRRLNGRLVNLPTRAMKGHNWTGVERDWKRAPEQYAAIHFHDDDLHDCRWPESVGITIPATLPSGVYGLALSCGRESDTIPFFVVPTPGARRARVAYLASTFTYQVYANFSRGLFSDGFRKRVKDWQAAPNNPDDHLEYGLSTYNRHRDGSGVAYSSCLRPMLTWRPDFVSFNGGESGLRHLPADTHLLAWFDRMGIAFDVLTDEELDREGPACLAPYKVVVTGTHPEYHTEASLDALQGYTETGGRLVYLGGNGFYWRVARSAAVPGVIEVRRTEGGIRTWAAEPGEYHHALDGAYGGLWRRSDRAPNLLAGIGFSSQGLFVGNGYRRTAAADDPAHAWVFEGVRERLFGCFGLSGGGAAGFELDRVDHDLGSPPNTVILATSEGHDPTKFVVVHEERLGFDTTIPGESLARLIRADMVHLEKPRGGAVFSTGSITYCGSLPTNGFDNDVSRLTFNVVNRFGELGLAWPFAPSGG